MRQRVFLLAFSVGLVSALVDAAGPPRLVVMLVVDSLRADALATLSGHWRAGFKTLLSEGAQFRQMQVPYWMTDTCAGHATLSTGVMPRTHGMVADSWWDAELKKNLECTEDENAKPVTYGKAARLGNSARWLRAQTLADRLRAQRPESRVVTLSLKARAAIGLAGHGGDAVTWFEDAAAAFVTSDAFAKAPVPAVKQAIDAAPFEKALDEVWRLRDAPASYRQRDAGLGERPPAGWSGLFPHVLKGEKGADAQFASQWRRSPMADAYLGRLAAMLVDAYKLGQGSSTDYLGVSFSAVDYISHAFGSSSLEAEDAIVRMDDVLGDLIAHLDRRVGRDNYVLALSADHGMGPWPSAAEGFGRVAPEDIRDRIEDALRRWDRAPLDGAYVEGIYRGNMYLSPAARRRIAADRTAIRVVEEAVMSMPGVERVLHGPSLTDHASDGVIQAAWRSRATGRGGDFVIGLKRNWMLTTRGSANTVDHGSRHDYDRRIPLLLLGAGVRRGVYDVPATSTDVAPTLAAIAGISLPGVEGRVLREALLPDVSSTR